MVGLRLAAHLRRTGLTLLLLAFAGNALAAVTASVDRERIEANESFTLKLTVDSTDDLSPDLSVLEADFDIGQTSQLTEAHIVFGDVKRSTSFSIVLTPKRAGELAIPAIRVGGETSQPLSITVTEPAYEPPGEADVFVTSEVDQAETYVQAQLLYRIKIYRAVATRQPALREPVFSGAEVLVEPASDERNYEAVLNGRAYNVVEYAFAVFPQESGEISISPARFEARVLRDGRITGRKVFASDAHSVVVNPIPAPPPDFPGASWLPARNVTLSESWSREPEQLKAGEPVSRDVTVSALGQLETQIPVLAPPSVDGINVYPDRPALSRELETDGIRGIRTDQYAIIGVAAETVTLPKLELPWWDIDAGEWKVAELPERTVTITGVPVAPPPAVEETPVAEAVSPPPAASDEALPPAVPSLLPAGTWQKVAALLALGWLATAVAWWWTARPERQPREAKPLPPHRQQARFLKAARQAALDHDAPALRKALLEWGANEWPERAPRSIGDIAGRVSEPLAGELRRLSRASYAAGECDWSGEDLARALRTFSVTGRGSAAVAADPLPPLMPG